MKKKIKYGLHNNPNDLKTNLTGRIFSDVEVEILKCGLKHGIATWPSEPEIMVIAENIWDQIERNSLCENLKPDKEMKKLFSDLSRFKLIQKDPTLTRLKTVQNYVNTMFKRNEISEEEKKQLWPITAQLGRARGLSKTSKAYANLPSSRPIIDTPSTPYYNIGKFLSSLPQPLTHNDYNLKDSFDAVERIRSIPLELFGKDYQFFLFF